ncbi:MAG: hypothetical protein K5694_00925 [Bacilli bacterium]|nr:hypothetical protein [Bacilli bacterium]
MKLRIVDYGYGIDRRSGQASEREVAKEVFMVEKAGPLPPFGPARHVFEILEVKENSIIIKCSPKREAVEINVRDVYTYRPLLRDGGHYYVLELEK